MDRKLLLLIGLGAVLAGLIYRSREQLTQTASDVINYGETILTNLTRGERNNNPGNIVKSNINWQGKVQGNDSRFETFSTPVAGIRALSKLLLSYYKSGFDTVSKIINRYAPSTENNTVSYINSVANFVGVSPTQKLNLNDPALREALVTAIINHENGRVSYAQDTINQAVNLA